MLRRQSLFRSRAQVFFRNSAPSLEPLLALTGPSEKVKPKATTSTSPSGIFDPSIERDRVRRLFAQRDPAYSIDFAITNTLIPPLAIVRRIVEDSDGLNSTLTDEQSATLLLRSVSQLAGAATSATREPANWNIASELNNSKVRSRSEVASRCVDTLESVLKVVVKVDGDAHAAAAKSSRIIRAELRGAALLRDAVRCRTLVDELVRRREVKQIDFHLAMHACRAKHYCDASDIDNHYELCIDTYRRMLRNGFKPTVPTVVALANAVPGTKIVDCGTSKKAEENMQAARAVHGMWLALLIQQSSTSLQVGLSVHATAAVIRAVGRAFRGAGERRLDVIENDDDSGQAEQEQPQSSPEQQEEAAAATDLATNSAKAGEGEALSLIQQIVRELMDALSSAHDEIGADARLHSSIATALCDIGEWVHCGRQLSKIYTTSSLSLIEEVRALRIDAAAARIARRAAPGNGSRSPLIGVATASLSVQAPLFAGIFAHAHGDAITARQAVAAALEKYVTCCTTHNRPQPPSATNMLLLSLLLHALTLNPGPAAVAALQSCFMVAALVSKRRLGWDCETLPLLLRAVEATALVSIAMDSRGSIDPGTCAALLELAQRFLVLFGTDFSKEEEESLFTRSPETLTPLTFLMSLAESLIATYHHQTASAPVQQLSEQLKSMQQLTNSLVHAPSKRLIGNREQLVDILKRAADSSAGVDIVTSLTPPLTMTTTRNAIDKPGAVVLLTAQSFLRLGQQQQQSAAFVLTPAMTALLHSTAARSHLLTTNSINSKNIRVRELGKKDDDNDASLLLLSDEVWATESIRVRMHQPAVQLPSWLDPSPFADFCEHAQRPLLDALVREQSAAIAESEGDEEAVDSSDVVRTVVARWL